ncbi:MAG: N-acetylmuramoyl-L-alanine amidase [Synergistaceae bacterium]|nr:N-acetylmuramoyl-L-alanine amidase [Synergistaceae bacterium]
MFSTLLFFVTLAFIFLTGILSVPAQAGVAVLYKGDSELGQVPVRDGPDGYAVSIADAGALLGLEASLAGEELLLTRGGNRLRIVPEAVAAWYNNQLIPLYGPGRIQDGRWWLDVPSLMSLLQRFAGNKKDDRLRLEEVRTAPPAKEEKTARAPAPAPSVKTQTPPEGELTVTSMNAPKETPSSPPAVSGAGTSPTPASTPASGEIRALRWSTSREKIRAVIDCSDDSNPEVKIAAGKISMNFRRIVDGLEGIPSPYENVDAELVQGTNLVTLTFSVSGVRIEKFVLDKPRRIVFDFIFDSPGRIKEVKRPESTAPVVSREKNGKAGTTSGKKEKMLVVLDPGHGGKDPGAVGNGFREKDITLNIGLQMEKALKAKGFNVIMTRNTDVYLTLQERTDIANQSNADMFVSIHVNALPPGKNSTGFEIYLMALPTDKDALNLAKIENREYLEDKNASGAASDRRTEVLLKILGDMQQNNKISESTTVAEVLLKAGNAASLPMKRVAQAPFFVLRGAGMPAVLLETGFITNAREAKLLAHPGYQQKIAEAMANGIYTYLK